MTIVRLAGVLLAVLALATPLSAQPHGSPTHAAPAPPGTPAGVPGGAPASAPATLAPSILTIGQMPTGDGRINVMARLVGRDQRPLGNQTVEFELIADFFGQRPVPIGSAVTMATGQAMFMYKPMGDGEMVRARFAGNATNAAASIEVKVAPDPNAPATSAHAAEDRALAPVWRITAWTAAVVSTAVWLALAGIVFSVWRGLKHGAPGTRA